MKKKVKITVVEIQGGGKCPLGHKIGDTFIYEGWPISNLCAAAFNILYPMIRVLSNGGSIPWEKEHPYRTRLCCYDPNNPVVFEVERLEEEYSY